jgi:hypothetical protein
MVAMLVDAGSLISGTRRQLGLTMDDGREALGYPGLSRRRSRRRSRRDGRAVRTGSGPRRVCLGRRGDGGHTDSLQEVANVAKWGKLLRADGPGWLLTQAFDMILQNVDVKCNVHDPQL